ncbi:6-phosphofructokinase [Natronobacillus azotifigens]|uniref:ATP-dependent 6-phosphofructokinase n=1 Tax=Natronobacillus azotifigens TaxID=472978 RepID=A0A9J6REI5_9BACI|nr:6-phosphofructokinase [Natronobacillus azotifigens]MCZ0703772.1 6-phosphofructokinase [Natronobacillus azotifigens]
MIRLKKIAVLTSGGDSQGMNSAIRAVVRTGLANGYEMLGVKRGFKGLMDNDFIPLGSKEVSDILYRGGTFLQSARSEKFKTKEGQKKAIANLAERGIDYLVVIGGDGSYKGAEVLHQQGIKTYGLPGTIDNDIPLTDYTIGFDTTLNVVTNAISNLRDTMSSHERVSVIEAMGRSCGDIALQAGISSGVDAILVPEVEADIEGIAAKLRAGFDRGKTHSIVIVAEGAGKADEVAKKIKELTNLDTKPTVLGHIQRGGTPTAFDRIFTSRMGHKVIDLIKQDISGVALGMEKNEITYHTFEEIFAAKNTIDSQLYQIFHDLI